MTERVFLASASPRRAALLREAGFEPIVRPTGVGEASREGETPDAHVARLAGEKGRHALALLRSEGASGVLVAADTDVVIDDAILGKPRDAADAARILRRLAGRTHDVLTAVFVARVEDGRSAAGVERTRVTFRAYGEESLRRYVATGEPMDKAGAYGIQGLGAELVERIDGSWSNVVGLPMELLPRLFRAIGAPWPKAGRPPVP